MTQSSGPDSASSAAAGSSANTVGLLRGKHYATPEVTVSYDAARCIHVRACVTGLPQVFDPAARPWIRPQNARAAQVAEVVYRCPSGALHAVLTAQDGAEQDERPQRPTTVTPLPDGPLAIRGELNIVTPQGEQRELRATLCRCGSSSNKPFCDGTHARVGWKG
ncbi:(4Fe-4S)-binding protein [Deinococcus altitudinis]|uniref:(4Fe-4S)-binding protein n=1 Tax=Deinococcus altitudinis TaxID=468914 RepID=UPI00389288CA